MDKFIGRALCTLPDRKERHATIVVKFEAYTTDSGSGIGYTALKDGCLYKGYRHVGSWSYNEALALSLLDALECLTAWKQRRLEIYHRGYKFSKYFDSFGCTVPAGVHDILKEVRKHLAGFKSITMKCISKFELKTERKLARRAAITPSSIDRIIEVPN